ncbi:MAG: DNA polymerase III subunit delta' [Magnetococcales bacterium]|nr:DNA polymerase III subunit delta' [Magnetococcales bacterium]
MTASLFDTIRGHGEIVGRMRGLLATGRPGHAWLFHGPEGVGKRQVAMALAQCLFCPAPVVAGDGGMAGCGGCPSCRKCAAAIHPDLQILSVQEKKTRIAVEQVRDLIRFMAFSPLEGAWKVAIVDDAALMNEASANAMLKTLEEPPPGSMLILITSQPGSLLPTIRSRCRQERFTLLDDETILAILDQVAPAIPLGERREAVRLAGGSAGEALRLSGQGSMAARREFLHALAGLPALGLWEVLELSAHWSHEDRFDLVGPLLETWFAERIRVIILQGEERRSEVEAMLEASSQVVRLLRELAIFNLNPRLTLEAILIRLARMQGAAF